MYFSMSLTCKVASIGMPKRMQFGSHPAGHKLSIFQVRRDFEFVGILSFSGQAYVHCKAK
jgi:hypothetical protein